MALPLSLHHDEDRSILLLTDSEDDDDLLPPSRRMPTAEPRPSTEAMRQKAQEVTANVPIHPIPAMQSAFAESLLEATNSGGNTKPKLRFGDARQRRIHLLNSPKGAGLHADAWRYRPGQKHHELWKLLAQVSFGVYLLLHGIANSNEQVVDILQGHIDEVDEFLETTLEDLNTALEDVKERVDFLKLPMENVDTFEQMLEDRDFRLQIVTGNEKIEHIIDRTTLALHAAIKDADEGLKAVKAFAVYLGSQNDKPWRQQRPEFGDIYDAMKGNAQGWYQALIDMQESASSLDNRLASLGDIMVETNQRAGEVSRRTRVSGIRLGLMEMKRLIRTLLAVFSSTVLRSCRAILCKQALGEVIVSFDARTTVSSSVSSHDYITSGCTGFSSREGGSLLRGKGSHLRAYHEFCNGACETGAAGTRRGWG